MNVNEIDQERLENLHNALDVQMRALDDAYNKKDYLSMVEYASNIEKLSYTIHFLKGNDDARRGSMTKFVSTETIDKMASVKEKLVEASDGAVEELMGGLNKAEKETLLRLYIDQSRQYRNVSGIFSENYREGMRGKE